MILLNDFLFGEKGLFFNFLSAKNKKKEEEKALGPSSVSLSLFFLPYSLCKQINNHVFVAHEAETFF